jgi:hypothetical protein
MEKPMNENCTALTNLLLAELAEGQGRFVDQILNGSWQLTEMATWSLSAHLGAFQSSKRSLPQERTQVVDLMAGDVGSLLSWVHYFFRDTFNTINPEITRLKQQIQQLALYSPIWIVTTCGGRHLNSRKDSWSITGIHGVTLMFLRPCFWLRNNPDIQLAGIYKTMSSVDRFINYVKTDGACEEGPPIGAMLRANCTII